jgi:hypothetical protein
MGREYDINLHLTEKIHMFTAIYTVLQIYVFMIIGSSIVPIFSSETYFSFGAPVPIAADPLNIESIDENSVIAGIAFFFMVDRVVTLAAEEAMLRSKTYPKSLKYVMIITYYMRYAAHVVFLRTQVSFALAVFIADILVYTLFKWVSINSRVAPKTFLLLTLVQVAEIPCFLMIYMFAGLFNKGLYFQVGPPLAVFTSAIITENVTYGLVVVISFLDMLLSCAVRNNIETWSSGTLQNSDKDHEELGMSIWEARLVSAARMIMYYVRIMFVYSFITTQYIFVVIYIIADIVVTIIYDIRCDERRALRSTHPKRDAPETMTAREKAETSDHDSTRIILLAMAQTVETLLIMVAIIVSHWFTESYFEWSHHIIIFDTHITVAPQIKLLLAYVAFNRVSATMMNNVVLPDFNNWMYTSVDEFDGKDLSKIYGRWRILWILVVMRAFNWFSFVVQIQFILSNYSFVVIAAAVDVPLSMIVNERHIRYKKHKGQVSYTESILAAFRNPKKD